jgi:DNA-binding GntR family transcriptional regulator
MRGCQSTLRLCGPRPRYRVRSIGFKEHRVLMDAIEQRDAARAERVMHDHLLAQLAALTALRTHERNQGSAHHA